MSQEALDVVTGIFHSTNDRDFAAVRDAYGEDVTLTLHGAFAGLSGEEVVRGKKAVGEWFGDWFRQFAHDYRFDLEEERVAGNRVFLIAAHHARGKASGVPVEQRVAYVYTVEAGKIQAVDIWPGAEERLAVQHFETG